MKDRDVQCKNYNVINIRQEKYIKMLTDDLPVFHACIGILQEELYVTLSIFRQIYIAVGTGRCEMN